MMMLVMLLVSRLQYPIRMAMLGVLLRFVFDTCQRPEPRVAANVRVRRRTSVSCRFQRRLRHSDVGTGCVRQDDACQHRWFLSHDTPDRVSPGSQFDDHSHFWYVRCFIQHASARCIQCVSKNTPDIFSCNLNKYFQISIIFGTSIT